MQQLAAVRPLVTAGVAAVGASMIALTPVVFNDLAFDLQHGGATIQQRAVELTDYVANPIQTWIDTFETTGMNIQSLIAEFQQHPFPVPQQLAANFLQYGVEYVQPYQQAANGAVEYFLGIPGINSGDNSTTLITGLQQAAADVAAGNISSAVPALSSALYTQPLEVIGQPLETIPQILNPITQNLANATDFLTTGFLTEVGFFFVAFLPDSLSSALGASLQNVYDSFTSGDPVGGVINAIDVPGEVTNAFLNGFASSPGGAPSGGILTPTDGTGLAATLIAEFQSLAEKIVAPGAQNIVGGGNLAFPLGFLGNVLATGFPTPQIIFNDLVTLIQTYVVNPYIGATAAAAANVGDLAALAPAAASLPGLSADFAALGPAMATPIAAALPASIASTLPGDVANIAGHLGADLASMLPGMIMSMLHF